jgi:hypothetical protein
MSRFYAVAASQLYNSPTSLYNPAGIYNAELIQPLSPEMQAKIRNYAIPIQK